MNAFGSFYANLSSNLANQILPGNTGIDYCLKQIPRSLQSFVMARTTKEEVERVIKSLPNKQSCGHDKVLKNLNEALSYPLTSIFNQSIAQGIFPNLMKVAEVIPLYKGKERDLELCKYRCKVSKQLLLEPLIKLVNDRGGKKSHKYETRNKHIPYVQAHKSPLYNNSFMCRGIQEFGKLPQSIKDNTILKGFVRQLKSELLK